MQEDFVLLGFRARRHRTVECEQWNIAALVRMRYRRSRRLRPNWLVLRCNAPAGSSQRQQHQQH